MSEYGEYAINKAAKHHLGIDDEKQVKITMKDAIYTAIERAFITGPGKPGEVISSLPENVKEVLKNSTSKDWGHRLN